MKTLFYALTVLVAVVQAHAENRLILDSEGMPLCLAENIKDPAEYLQFVWVKNDRYRRNIYAVSKDNTFENHWGSFFEDCILNQNATTYLNPRVYTYKPDDTLSGFSKLMITPEGARDLNPERLERVKNKHFTPEDWKHFAQASAQVALGGNTFRSEDSAEDYLKNHPIRDFSLALNRELTGKYGIAFTSQIYKAWIESQSRNAEFKSKMLDYFEKIKTGNVKPVKDRYKKHTVFIVKGIAHTLNNNKRFSGLINHIKDMGIEVVVGETLPFGRLKENEEMLNAQLEPLLAQGKHLIVISGSKGSTDVLGAMANFSSRTDGPNRQSGYGSFDGMINFSGVIAGAFVTDWITAFPQWDLMVRKLLFSQFNQLGANLKSPSELDGFKDLTQKACLSYFKVKAALLPRSTQYVSLVGTLLDDGLTKDEDILAVQNEVTRKRLSGYGANDGYVEFPGTTFPESWGLNQYTLAVNAGHSIKEGTFEGHDLMDRQEFHTMLEALLQTLGDSLGL